ncbi:hypothetical protein DVH24_014779 [Malus domestica]|uniref:Leucine-rich repeat-containing N-terminal plant-type domain-containing protein n=1 Tax=Malus domestica TaxID=3750 RepID=A0A498JZV4_MALDO|nr:hypothetical protein DVH24_014779 [Malus domestica]
MTLHLASNKLREIPGFLINQSELSELDLSENHIQGEIPNWIWSFRYLSLNLSCNSLVTLEAHFTTSNVIILDLHSNQLQGEIPYTSPNAIYLDYSSNHFCCSIPADIGDFFNLDTSFLSLSNNNLRASFQHQYAREGLGVLNLRRNNLTRTISNFEFLESCGLHTLDLGENRIKGQFPKSLANYRSLQFLNLGNNQMKDAFPCLLLNISTLHVLLLRSNKFYGCIACPKTNGTWPMLQIIDLADNNLSGEIPRRSLATWLPMRANEDDSLGKAKHLKFFF